jgi:hypothetical protein
MTVSPSLSGIADHATSSILDSSNYTIQAVSFGTGSEAFRQNAHRSDGAIRLAKVVQYSLLWVGGTVSPSTFIYEDKSTHPMDGFYTPSAGLPIAPEPMLNVLEENTSVSAQLSGTTADTSGGVYVSSVYPGNGQLTNFLPSGIFSSMMEDTVFSSTTSGYAAATFLGCFTDGSTIGFHGLGSEGHVQNLEILDDGTTSLVWTTQQADCRYQLGSFFNEVSSMDVSGFVNMVMSGSPGTTTGYAMSSGASGLCVSGGHDSTNSGTVEYTVMISADDLNFANSYGGIYHLGLWGIDMKQSLLNGNTPPFAFSVLNNPRKYKLFARKGLSKNLCYIINRSAHAANMGAKNYLDLTIKWRLDFL